MNDEPYFWKYNENIKRAELNFMVDKHKISDREKFIERCWVMREGLSNERQVVFVNGCFDLLNIGHIRFLETAAEYGWLAVAINSDASVRRLKGEGRPIYPQDVRAEMLAALECVRAITIFDEDTPLELITRVEPDFLINTRPIDEIVGRTEVESYGGKVVSLPRTEGVSTTETINRIREKSGFSAGTLLRRIEMAERCSCPKSKAYLEIIGRDLKCPVHYPQESSIKCLCTGEPEDAYCPVHGAHVTIENLGDFHD